MTDHGLHGSTTANLGATTPRLRAGWTGMLDGTSWSLGSELVGIRQTEAV